MMGWLCPAGWRLCTTALNFGMRIVDVLCDVYVMFCGIMSFATSSMVLFSGLFIYLVCLFTLRNFSACFVMCRCPVMLVVGQSSAQLDDTIDMNSKLDPKTSTWVKVCYIAVLLRRLLQTNCDLIAVFDANRWNDIISARSLSIFRQHLDFSVSLI